MTQPVQESPASALARYLRREDVFPSLVSAAVGLVKPDDLVRLAVVAATRNPDIAKCHPHTIVRALMDAATLDIAPTGLLGRGYLVPRFDKKLNAQALHFDPGYRGLMDVAYATGEVRIIRAACVYFGEDFSFVDGIEPVLRHVPAEATIPPGQTLWDAIRCAWAIAIMSDGTPVVAPPMWKSDLTRIRGASAARSGGPWFDWPDEMAKKSAIRRLCKMLPIKSPKMAHALHVSDQADGGLEDEEPTDTTGSATTNLVERLRAKGHGGAPQAPPSDPTPTDPTPPASDGPSTPPPSPGPFDDLPYN